MSLHLSQSSNGYRYSIDAFLLADFCGLPKDFKILDLGSGCGIVSILLAKAWPNSQIVGIDIQPDLIKFAKQNLQKNKFLKNIKFILGDIREISNYFFKEEFGIVITNPPYHKIGSGRINPNPGKASARHEIIGGLKEFIHAGFKVLKPKGSFYIIYTAKRTPELICELIKNKLEPKILRNVHPKENNNANLVLIKATKMGKPGLKILPPIYLFKNDGKYSNESKRILKKWNFF
jgi:tRNA1Val (adenine37-N6)-methyltransferase